MSFFKNKGPGSKSRFNNRLSWKLRVYKENGGLGGPQIKDLNKLEFMYYGFIDNQNYSVVPIDGMLADVTGEKLYDDQKTLIPVAAAWRDLKINYDKACLTNKIKKHGAFGDLKVVQSYSPPRFEYNNHLSSILRKFNQIRPPDKYNITSYRDYVNAFLDLVYNEGNYNAVTLSGFNKSYRSSILNTGLAIKYLDIPYDEDQVKIKQILNHESFPFFKRLCLNYGFSILHDNPNIIVFDINSPAALKYHNSNTDSFFNSYFNRTHIHDIKYINNNLILYYNKYVDLYPETVSTYVHCGKTYQNKITRKKINPMIDHNVYDEIAAYTMIRNAEEGRPFSEGKIKNIIKKANYLQKKFDKLKATGYISKEFKNQVWTRPYGYDDFLESFKENPSYPTDRRTGQKKSKSPSGGSSGY